MEEKIQENQPDEQVLPQTPSVIGKRKVKPFTIAILLIVILLISVGLVYAGMQISKRNQPKVWIEPPLTVATPQPTEIIDKTGSWKTYTNEVFGYSLKYP